MNHSFVQRPDGYLDRTPWLKFILISALFGIWGTAVALNSVLIAQFKEVFTLSNIASALIQSAYFGAYFFVSIPTAMIIKKYSYRRLSFWASLSLPAVRSCFIRPPWPATTCRFCCASVSWLSAQACCKCPAARTSS